MSSDSSDSEGPGNGGKPLKLSGPDTSLNEKFGAKKGPQTPRSPESMRSRSRSQSPSDGQSRSSSRSPAHESSPARERGPRSPPALDDDDGRSNISSGSSILSDDYKKQDEVNGILKEKPPSPSSKNRFQVPNAEDLSDVSDIDDSDGLANEDNKSDEQFDEPRKGELPSREPGERRVKDTLENTLPKERQRLERGIRSSLSLDDGEQLDFETEDPPDIDREDGELETSMDRKERIEKEEGEQDGDRSGDDGELKEDDAESLEEGEVTDEGDPKPEKPPICRFYSRGACTWGINCRFLHPGVTDKGNYSMFDVTRPMVASANGMGLYPPEPRPYPLLVPAGRSMAAYAPVRREDPAAVESAWERGLRQAKEMMRKSTKRKETDMDFEEKKMNLSIGQDEMDKENDYYARAASPADDPEPWTRYSPKVDAEARRPAVRVVERYEDIIPEPHSPGAYERYEYRRGYERLRDPEYLLRREKKYYGEEELLARKGGKKMVREVIVQRAERAKRIAAETGRRPDEWADPWMRSKSPLRKGHRARKVSYSSGSSSYSGSSSSRSSSNSSYSSYSRSRSRSGSRSRSRSGSGSRSPSRPQLSARAKAGPEKDPKFRPLVREGADKPVGERPMMMNPPAPTPRRIKEKAMSPSVMRKVGLNPPAPTPKLRTTGKHSEKRGKPRSRKSRSSSESGSSGSSSESSRSSYSSSSSSSRDGASASRPPKKIETNDILAAAALKGKGVDALKLGGEKQQMKLLLKATDAKRDKPVAPPVSAAKKRPAEEPAASDPAGSKKASSRREELLKQLKAVEDAIAKKRSKI